jgi:hypothetical protein
MVEWFRYNKFRFILQEVNFTGNNSQIQNLGMEQLGLKQQICKTRRLVDLSGARINANV